MPAISVVIPAYNAARTLPRALDSVLAQTWPAHEVVVVDDGSSDATCEVMESYLRRPDTNHVQYIRQANSGPSAARNRGVAATSAQWIAFLDADDWYYAGRLAAHAHLITANPDLDFVVGNFDYRDKDETLLRTSMSTSSLGRELIRNHGENGHAVIEGPDLGRFIAEQFSDTRMLTLPRSTFIELGGFPLDLKICEDVVFLLRLCARSQKAGVTCESGAVYWVHDAGLIRSDRLRAQTETIRALRGQGTALKSAASPVRAAWRKLVKDAYSNLAFYLLKNGRPGAAAVSLARSFLFRPTPADIKHLLSIIRG